MAGETAIIGQYQPMPFMKLRWLVYSTLSLALPLVHAAAPAKPNVLFILVDDFGVNDVGIEGSKFYETPNIDALAKSGVFCSQEAMRIFGGYSYSVEYEIERYYRDAMLMCIGEGTNEMQRIIIAKQLIARNPA